MTPQIVARQAPLSMRFSMQEYWSGLPCPPPEDLPNPGTELKSPALQADPLLSETPGKPIHRAVKVLSPLSALHPILQKPRAAPEGFSEHITLCLVRTLPLYLECFLLHTSLQLLIILLASRDFLLQESGIKCALCYLKCETHSSVPETKNMLGIYSTK